MGMMTRYEEKMLEIERERNKLLEKLVDIEQKRGKEYVNDYYVAGYKAGYADAMKDSNYNQSGLGGTFIDIDANDPLKAINMR